MSDIEDKIRQEFEKHYRKVGPGFKTYSDFNEIEKRAALNAWQARQEEIDLLKQQLDRIEELNARLKSRNFKLEAEWGTVNDYANSLEAKLKAAEARAAMMGTYAKHKDGCTFWDVAICNCGFDTCASDWLTKHDAELQAKLDAAEARAMQMWLAIDTELVTMGSTFESYASPKAAINAMLDWHVAVALDPAVSADAREIWNKVLEEVVHICNVHANIHLEKEQQSMTIGDEKWEIIHATCNKKCKEISRLVEQLEEKKNEMD